MSDERISAYLDGALRGDEREAFERALAADPTLAADLAEIGEVRSTLQSLPWREASEGFVDELIAVLAADGVTRTTQPRRSRRWAALGAAAAAVSLAVLLADESDQLPVRPAIDEAGEGHVTNAGLADDPILLLAPTAGTEP